MSILVRFAPASLTAKQYDESISRLEAEGAMPADGLEYHVCWGSDGSLHVSEIWNSKGQFEAFGEQLMPILADVGIEPGEPEIVDVHNVIKP